MDKDNLRELIYQTNKKFYEKIYKDKWLSKVFESVEQEKITMQQTDFMLGAFGGAKVYSGRNPSDAHTHIFIDQEMWDLREKYLKEAFVEVNLPEDMRLRWIKIDDAFKKVILKNKISDCKKRYNLDEIIHIPNPAKKVA